MARHPGNCSRYEWEKVIGTKSVKKPLGIRYPMSEIGTGGCLEPCTASMRADIISDTSKLNEATTMMVIGETLYNHARSIKKSRSLPNPTEKLSFSSHASEKSPRKASDVHVIPVSTPKLEALREGDLSLLNHLRTPSNLHSISVRVYS